MSAFHYVALDAKGKQRKGIIEGDNNRHARQRLREQGLIPVETINARERDNSQRSKWSFGTRKRSIKVADLALTTRQMATLIAAGLPVEEVLLAASEQTEKPHIKGILMGVRARVLEGHTLAYGLREFPRAFPHLYCATIAAGEQSGHLDHILLQLADYIEKQNQIQQKILQAMVYPSLMILISLGIVTFLLIYVVPQIVGVFDQTNAQLPGITQLLLIISSAVQNYGIYALLAMILLAYGFKRILKNEISRYRFHQILLRIPVIGKNLKTINSARFLRTLGILFAATVPILEAMRVANDLISLLPMRQAVTQAIHRIQEGGSIHKSLQQTHYFAPMSVHLIASGETSGQLESMLTKVADNQDAEVTRLIEYSLTLFEPILIIIMGNIVLFIVLAILLPIFQLDVTVGQS